MIAKVCSINTWYYKNISGHITRFINLCNENPNLSLINPSGHFRKYYPWKKKLINTTENSHKGKHFYAILAHIFPHTLSMLFIQTPPSQYGTSTCNMWWKSIWDKAIYLKSKMLLFAICVHAPVHVTLHLCCQFTDREDNVSSGKNSDNNASNSSDGPNNWRLWNQ